MKKRWFALLGLVGTGVWGLFDYMTDRSPEEAGGRLAKWFSLPWVTATWSAVSSLVSSPLVFIPALLLIGGAIGFRLRPRWDLLQAPPKAVAIWHTNLARQMMMAAALINDPYRDDEIRLNAVIRDVQNELIEKGFKFPRQEDGYRHMETLRPYLLNVATALRKGRIDIAREAAEEFSAPRN